MRSLRGIGGEGVCHGPAGAFRVALSDLARSRLRVSQSIPDPVTFRNETDDQFPCYVLSHLAAGRAGSARCAAARGAIAAAMPETEAAPAPVSALVLILNEACQGLLIQLRAAFVNMPNDELPRSRARFGHLEAGHQFAARRRDIGNEWGLAEHPAEHPRACA